MDHLKFYVERIRSHTRCEIAWEKSRAEAILNGLHFFHVIVGTQESAHATLITLLVHSNHNSPGIPRRNRWDRGANTDLDTCQKLSRPVFFLSRPHRPSLDVEQYNENRRLKTNAGGIRKEKLSFLNGKTATSRPHADPTADTNG